ncbi:MAG: 3'-5' exonuclease [Simkaniaceae bacterium]|jgi:oligoribonuclease|nr:MAG: 3'-5' exonuclease [Simkaniaceae bacterium]
MLGIFLDSETNGLNVRKHRIIELAYKIVDMESGEVMEAFDSPLFIPFEEWKKSDPLSLEINGFSWHDLKDGMEPQKVSDQVKLSFKQCNIQRGKAVFICQNPSFDRAFFSQLIDTDIQEQLNWPYHWLDLASMYWSKCIREGKSLPWDTGVSKNKIAAAMGLPPEVDPHKAMNGVDHLILCYEAVVGFPSKVIK